MSRMADTKALAEVKTLELFYQILMCDPNRAFYGVKHVEKANEHQAVETLLISDNLFRLVSSFFCFSVFLRKYLELLLSFLKGH